MGIAYDVLSYLTEHSKWSIQFLALMLSIFPFLVIAVLFLLILGVIPSPLLSALDKIGKDHSVFSSQSSELTNSMIQINRVAEDYYELLRKHSEESKRKEQLIQFLVLEGCRRDHESNPAKCDRLEHKLKELDP